MPLRHLFAIALALIVSRAAPAPEVMAQSSTAPANKQPVAQNAAIMRPMVFYDAHGDANACGPGCSEWIAADGKIDRDSADRLVELLAHLKGAYPPIFFHSPGGSVTGSIALGEIMRARKLTVSVGHTVPLNCDGDTKSENSCDVDIRAGRPIEARLDPLTAMCNSGCVYALAGGSVRLIPPWVTLGIHDIGIDVAAAKIRHPNARIIEMAKAVSRRRLRNYIRRMGIDEDLLTEAFATPFTSIGRLTRDDAARFRLDSREFGETGWQFVDKPQPAIRKMFFVRADSGERGYVNALVNVSCAPRLGGRAIAALARERQPADTDSVVGQPAASIRMDALELRLARRTSAKLYLWSGQLPLAAFEAVSEQAAMVVSGEELGRRQGPSGDVRLALTGFSAAFTALQKECVAQTAQTRGTQAVTGMFPAAKLRGPAPSASALPPRQPNLSLPGTPTIREGDATISP